MTPPPAGRPPLPGRLLVTVATYNERENVERLLPEILAKLPDARVLVIDDNSPDGTGRLVDEMAARDGRISALHRPGKLGLGTALLAAMRHAIAHKFDYMLNMDADFSHPPRYLPDIAAGMAGRDVMIGSRYVKGGGTTDWPWSRELISRAVNLLVRAMLRMGPRDASGAFRCYRVSLLEKAQLDRVVSKGYSFQQEVLYRCWLAGARIGETPIVFENRKFGKSKVSAKESLRSILMLFRLGLRRALMLDRRAKPPIPSASVGA